MAWTTALTESCGVAEASTRSRASLDHSRSPREGKSSRSSCSSAANRRCAEARHSGARTREYRDPSYAEQWEAVVPAGLEMVPIPVDAAVVQIEVLERAAADAVVVTPAHQHPSGAVMAGERRAVLLAWPRDRDAIALEDDYDAEYRYDRAPVGALQSLDPDRILYGGTASKTLAPAFPRRTADRRSEPVLPGGDAGHHRRGGEDTMVGSIERR